MTTTPPTPPPPFQPPPAPLLSLPSSEHLSLRTSVKLGAVVAIVPWLPALWNFAHYLTPGPQPLPSSFLLEMLIMPLPLLLIGAFFAGLIMFIQRRSRYQGLVIAACAVIGFGGMVAYFKSFHGLRHRAFSALAERSMPLVHAIKQYEIDNNAPPGNLKALVPRYIPAVPHTGLDQYPDYTYKLDPEENPPNRWVLIVESGFGMSFDSFIYLPSETYPKVGWGGQIERIGHWAYVHE